MGIFLTKKIHFLLSLLIPTLVTLNDLELVTALILRFSHLIRQLWRPWVVCGYGMVWGLTANPRGSPVPISKIHLLKLGV